MMMKKNLLIFAVGLLLLCLACGKDENAQPTLPSNSINKIMPLGASRVEGARPNFESYRYNLWKLLKDGDWTFDFVGTMEDDANYPTYAGEAFDLDHEGRGGWTSGQILAEIDDWLKVTGAPDVVLFSSPGGNDGLSGQPFEQAVKNVNDIIDALQAANPNVTIVIEQMAPGRSDIMTGAFSTLLNNMQQEVLTIANEQTTATSQVIAVDMFSGFDDSYLADEVHYNEAGAQLVAERYYAILVDVLE